MLINFLSSLLHLFSELCYVTPYLLYMFSVVLFIASGSWVKVIILLYFVTLDYDMTKWLVMRLIWYLSSALPSSPYFRSHLSENINNYTLYLLSSENQFIGHTRSFTFPFFSRLVTIALENFEYPWDVQTGMFLLLCLLNVFQVLFKVKKLFKNTT